MKLNDYADDIQLFSAFSKAERDVVDPLQQAINVIAADPMSASFVTRYPVPHAVKEKRGWLQAALTVRSPGQLPPELVLCVDSILQKEQVEKTVTDASTLERLTGGYPAASKISIWNGDITRLKIDAVTNAANAQMLGCFQPFHSCIDNAINCAAGPQLREDCNQLMQLQGSDETTGSAKITRAYNLPSKFVLHTVGPIIQHGAVPSPRQIDELASCYDACLSLAAEAGAQSVAVCGISTGVFGYPAEKAANVALQAVANWFLVNPDKLDHLVFNTFGDNATEIYHRAIGEWQHGAI
ncbi:protein-ADP-ribose hydrolase [Shewanella woodyi]|uniref:Protein-ADP-ribose hydrolase n=1 Tax=Shewanella woodyi (strain ATCC 51908 / MS32) TaxID=392500 RepID=B1KG04_SHEWM|nr:protein-ADP-ribose hydrolase [Shewanella woodyi]ACA86711.1 Appr-1-p processing domain protein [Shewanella woodyi ATCC 51908]